MTLNWSWVTTQEMRQSVELINDRFLNWFTAREPIPKIHTTSDSFSQSFYFRISFTHTLIILFNARWTMQDTHACTHARVFACSWHIDQFVQNTVREECVYYSIHELNFHSITFFFSSLLSSFSVWVGVSEKQVQKLNKYPLQLTTSLYKYIFQLQSLFRSLFLSQICVWLYVCNRIFLECICSYHTRAHTHTHMYGHMYSLLIQYL